MTIGARFGPKVVAAALLVLLVAIVWFTQACFDQDFHDWAKVSVIADRAGLVMDRGAKVKVAGVTVGAVENIDYSPKGKDGSAELSLRVDRAALASIPANVHVDITSTTVFGAKFVSLTPPAAPVRPRLADGAVIDISHVTVELNTVFEDLTNILHAVDPAKLNATLSAFAVALQGRGDRVGDALQQAATAIAKINAANPTLDSVLTSIGPTTQLYGDISPDLLRSLEALTTTGKTLVDDQHKLNTLLLNVIDLANTGNGVTSANAQSIATVLRLLRPTTALLAEYSPEIPCVFEGITAGNKVGWDTYHSKPGVKMSIGLLPGTPAYSYPADLPKVAASGGPHCMGLPGVPTTAAPYLVTDIGVNPFAPDKQGVGFTSPNLFALLFGQGAPK